VVDLYACLSTSVTKEIETSWEGDSAGTLKSDGKPAGPLEQEISTLVLMFYDFVNLPVLLYADDL
jgi:hypothetical protein